MGKHSESTAVGGHWRRRIGVVGVLALAGGAMLGVAGAAPTTSTTAVAFVPLTVPHKVLSATIGAHKSSSPVVIGAATTVPADATTVQLTVTAKGLVGGALGFYPAGNVGGGSGQSLTYPPGSVLVDTTIEENAGQSGEVTIANNGSGSVTVAVTVIGYSTQVTAGDINGVGGTAGQVLTNTGTRADWETIGRVYASGGWRSAILDLPPGPTSTLQTVTVPAGTYAVNAVVQVENLSATRSYVSCKIESPPGNPADDGYADVPAANSSSNHAVSIATLAAVATAGGAIVFTCYSVFSTARVISSSLVAIQEGSATGDVYGNAEGN
jgi:hypothetical protein